MKRRLCGAYYFEWLGQQDRKLFNGVKPLEDGNNWPEWAVWAYMYGYWNK